LHGLRAATIDAWRVQRIYSRIVPDVIHAQAFSEYALASPVSIPLVLTVHGLALPASAIMQAAYFQGAIGIYRRWVGEWTVRRSVQKAKVVISTAGDYVRQAMGVLLDGKRIYDIANPLDSDTWFGITNTSGFDSQILSVGTVIEWKNTLGLIQAFAQVAHQVSEAKLILVGGIGDLAYYSRVQKEITRLGLWHKVDFLGQGRLDHAQLLKAYGRASIVVLASIQETAPMAVAQAMAAGKPVVATRVGGLPWMVEEGVTGYLVDVGDTQSMADRIVELLRNKAMCQRMGQAAREVARERFAADRVAEQTVQVYRDLVGYKEA
jgi:glycosyltransferase involved in cell wall biosynthesis